MKRVQKIQINRPEMHLTHKTYSNNAFFE